MNWFKREKWALVMTITHNIHINERPGTFYFHLYESNLGNRKVKFSSTVRDVSNLLYIANQLPMYHEKILRWEAGRVDPDIPRYDEIPVEETVNILSGKIRKS